MTAQPTIKLQAYIAQHGVTSRRKAEELIEAGKVVVNGERAHIGQRIDPNTAVVLVAGERIGKPINAKYFLIYKPRGVISTTSDELGRRTVLSLIPPQDERLYPVGRLDRDSEGLMLLTNDGDLAHKYTHPSFGVEKTYRVTPDRRLSRDAYEHLERGVKLKDGWAKPTALAELHNDDSGELEITMTEGRNQEIRRMLRRVGYEVARLIRVRLGDFHLSDLNGADWIELQSNDVSSN
ncbi:MAG: pseudouridine synthase [Patescibacteria group bacterium]